MVLPVPVEPATKRWGILARSAKAGFAATSLPKAKVRVETEFWKFGCSIRFFKRTTVLTLLGISMPTSGLPGMGASILIGWAAKAKDKSEDRVVIFESLMPSAGLRVYWV